jgi:hypothetical protein
VDKRSPASKRTPRQKFEHYLRLMLGWQRLPRGSVESDAAMRAWLAQGQHTGGKAPKPVSTTEEGQRIKRKRDRWRFAWREKIRGDSALTNMADEAGVLDTPRPDAMSGDFANPDSRVYKAIVPKAPQPDAEPTEPAPTVAQALAAWNKKPGGHTPPE